MDIKNKLRDSAPGTGRQVPFTKKFRAAPRRQLCRKTTEKRIFGAGDEAMARLREEDQQELVGTDSLAPGSPSLDVESELNTPVQPGTSGASSCGIQPLERTGH